MRKSKGKWYAIQPSSNGARAEVRIFGEIGWFVTAREFIRELDNLSDKTDLDVRINSVGGSVFEGLQIFNRLKMHKGNVQVTVESLAASMASVIACAADELIMLPQSMLMIHNPSTAVWGDQDDLEKAARTLGQIKELLIDAYTPRWDMGRDEIAELMDDETWYTAQQALDAGIINGLGDDAAEDDLDLAASIAAADFSWFKHTPKPLLASAAQATEPQPSQTPQAPFAFVLLEPTGSQPAATTPTHGETMTPEEQAAAEKAAKEKAAQEAVAKYQAEQKERAEQISALFAGTTHPGAPDLLRTCLDDPECTIETAKDKFLELLKGDDDVTPSGSVQIVEDNADKRAAAVVNWIGQRAGAHDDNGQVIRVNGDNPFRGLRLQDIARNAAELAGINTQGMMPQEIVAAAITHSTSDFPNLMQNAMHKVLLDAFNRAGDTWSAFCREGDLSDFRPHWRHIEGSFSDLLPADENGEIQDGTLDDTRKESITGSTKGRILNLSNQAIINDDMSVFSSNASAMGRAARRSVEKDVYALLALNSGLGPTMSDGNPLFDASHGNIGTGAPSVDAIDTAITTIRSQQMPNSESGAEEYLDPVNDPVFVGPLALRGDVTVINEAQYDPDTSNKLQKPNKSRGLLGPIVTTPRLSGVPWYLFPDPEEIPVIEVGFVQGEREPQMMMREEFRQYGVGWRVIYNYGVAAVNWLGCYRSTGA